MKTPLFAYLIKFRRLIAAGCAGLAALLVLGILIRGNAGPTTVVVATRDIGAGTTLTAEDLAESTIATDVPWQGLLTTKRAAIGRTTSHAIAIGQPLGASDIVGTDLLKGQQPGMVAFEIAASHVANISVLEAGNHIDLLVSSASDEGDVAILAHNVLVLAKGNDVSSGLNISTGSSTGLGVATQAAPLLVAVTATQAKKIAARLNENQLVAVLLRK